MADAGKGLLNGAPVVSEVGGGQFLAERPAWVFLPVGSRDEAFIDVDRPGPDHVGKGERRRTARFRAMAREQTEKNAQMMPATLEAILVRVEEEEEMMHVLDDDSIDKAVPAASV